MLRGHFCVFSKLIELIFFIFKCNKERTRTLLLFFKNKDETKRTKIKLSFSFLKLKYETMQFNIII